MESYEITIKKKPKNHPLNVEYEETKTLTKKEFVKFKRNIKKDKKNNFKYSVLSGETEPLLLSEKIILCFRWFISKLPKKKTISQMQVENIRREYYHKKYFWFYIIITAIISSIITIIIGSYLRN